MRILNRRAYNAYLLGLALLAAGLLFAGERLPGIGAWVAQHPGTYLLAVGGGVLLLATLPYFVIFLALGRLMRTAREAYERLGAGDLAGGREAIRQLERWTPRLRWLMLNPAQVESMRELVGGVDAVESAMASPRAAAGASAGAPARGGATSPFRVVRIDDNGSRDEVSRAATREEAERQRETLERTAGGHKVLFEVEGPSNGRPVS